MHSLHYDIFMDDLCSYFVGFDCDAEEFGHALDEAYARQKENFTIEGYEKGQAPRTAVQAAKGDDIFYFDGINILMERYVEQICEELCEKNDCVPLTAPKLNVGGFDEKDGVSIDFTFMVSPKVTLGPYKGLTFAYPRIPCPEGSVEMQLELLRRRVAAVAGKDAPLPALDDAFAMQCGVESLATLREEITTGLTAHIDAQSRRQGIYLLLEKIGQDCTFQTYHKRKLDDPSAVNILHYQLLEEEYQRGIRGLKENLAAHGVSMETYLAQHGKTAEEFEADQRAGAERSLRGKLAAYAIAQAEGITATEMEVKAEQIRLSAKFKMSVADFLADTPAFLVKNDLILTRTLAFLEKNNTLTPAL